MRKTGLLIAAIGLLMAMAVPAVAAPPERESVFGQESLSEFLGVDRYWTTAGSTEHMRGWSAVYITNNELTHDYFDDMRVMLDVSWNLNLKTGRGGMWGTFEYRDATGGDRGWVGTFTAHWTEDGGWAGVGRGQGVGDYDGMQLRMDVWNDQPGVPQDEFDGYVFTPGS